MRWMFCLVLVLFLVSCVPQQVSDEELAAELAKLTPEEREALMNDLENENGALAGQAIRSAQYSPTITKASTAKIKDAINTLPVPVPSPQCGSNQECPYAYACIKNKCVQKPCKVNGDCPTSYTCDNLVCKPSPKESQREVFVGPLAGWQNVKTKYGAIGDGVADDTAALQNALNDLQQVKYHVLYIPSGTYRITSTLNLPQGEAVGMKIVGEDPATTKIIWDGPAKGSMFFYNPNFASLGRLTFDGKSKAGIILEHGPVFSSWEEYFDLVFKDAEVCMEVGKYDKAGISDSLIIRTTFLRCSLAGVLVNNWNSLQFQIYDSLFKDNYIGVSNTPFNPSLTPGAGNFHIYQSVFMNSTLTDTGIGAAGFFSIRDSISIGSNAFHFSTGTASPADVTLQRNVIIDPKGDISKWNSYYGGTNCMNPDNTRFAPICVGNAGTLILLDNIFRVRKDYAGGIVQYSGGSANPTFISIGNTYTTKDWFGKTNSPQQSKLRSIKDVVVDQSTIADVIPKLPPTPAKINPPLFEITAGADATVIQKAIDDAVKFTGQRPTIHLPAGTYPVAQTLVIPPNTDLQIIGDSDTPLGISILKWVGKGNGPVLRIDGPSKATLRDFSINGKKGTYDGLVVTGVDQPQGRVRTQQVMTEDNNVSFFLNKLNSVPIEFLNTAPDGIIGRGSIGFKIIGPGGGQQGAKILMMGEGGSLSDVTYDIENAYVLVRDAWTESIWASAGAELTSKYVRLRGNTIFTLHNFFQDLPRDVHPENVTILIDNINGKASFIGGTLSASTLTDAPEDQHSYDSFVDIGDPEFESTPAVIVQGNNPLMKTAVIASTGEGNILFQNKASAGEVGQVYLSTFSPDIKLLDDWGKTDDNFLLEMFEQTRKYGPISPASTASGFSDVYLHRIFVNGADTGITIAPSYCGNKIKEGNEQCDDGKVSGFCGYGKTSACQICMDCTGYAPGKTTYCGDKICDIKYESTTSCQQDCGLACPTNNLVSWWPADNNAEDLISKNHGELQGDAIYTAGMVGNSFSFDGDKDFVLVGDPFDGSLDFGSDDFTISFWGRSNGDGFFVAKGCSSCTNGLGYDVDIAGGGKEIIYRINGGPSGGGIIAGANTNNADLKQWHHYAGVYNRKGLLEMYLDGQSAGTTDISGESGSIDNTAPFLIGALQSPNGAGSINGQVDEVAVWRRTLSATEIKAIYDAGNKGMCKI